MKNEIEIDHYDGGSNVLLIITGIGGSTKGYENKYQRIAQKANAKHNATVFVATTPLDSWEHPKENVNYILNYVDSYMKNKKINDYSIYAMGHSAGGNFLIWYAHEFSKIKRVVAVNPVLALDLDIAISGIQNFKGDSIKVIIGEKDQSMSIEPILNLIQNKKFEHQIIPNADHFFTDQLDQFIDIPEKFLYSTSTLDQLK